jgi:hypothetical protein
MIIISLDHNIPKLKKKFYLINKIYWIYLKKYIQSFINNETHHIIAYINNKILNNNYKINKNSIIQIKYLPIPNYNLEDIISKNYKHKQKNGCIYIKNSKEDIINLDNVIYTPSNICKNIELQDVPKNYLKHYRTYKIDDYIILKKINQIQSNIYQYNHKCKYCKSCNNCTLCNNNFSNLYGFYVYIINEINKFIDEYPPNIETQMEINFDQFNTNNKESKMFKNFFILKHYSIHSKKAKYLLTKFIYIKSLIKFTKINKCINCNRQSSSYFNHTKHLNNNTQNNSNTLLFNKDLSLIQSKHGIRSLMDHYIYASAELFNINNLNILN